jgi:hypothetical protein
MALPVVVALMSALGLWLRLTSPRRIARTLPRLDQADLDRMLPPAVERRRSSWGVAAFSAAAAVSDAVLGRWTSAPWVLAALLAVAGAVASRRTGPAVRRLLLDAGAREPRRSSAERAQHRRKDVLLDAGAIVMTLGVCLLLTRRHSGLADLGPALAGVGTVTLMVGIGLLAAAIVQPGLHRDKR